MLNKYVEQILEKVTKEVVSENIDKKETLQVLKSKLIEAEKTNFPGMSTYTKISKEDNTINTDAYDAVAKKLKAYLKAMVDNSNPEFPHQNNSKTDYKSPMYRNSTEQEEYIDDWRGGGMEDLEYDTDPGDDFRDRTEKYIKGSIETGNNTGKGSDGQQVANVVPSDLGDKIIKKQRRKHKKLQSDKYSFALPNDWTQKPNAGFVSTESIGKKENIISEQIKKVPISLSTAMKTMIDAANKIVQGKKTGTITDAQKKVYDAALKAFKMAVNKAKSKDKTVNSWWNTMKNKFNSVTDADKVIKISGVSGLLGKSIASLKGESVRPRKETISENVKRDMKLISHLVNYNKKTQ